VTPEPASAGAEANANASPESRASSPSPGKSKKEKHASRKSKKRIAPEPLQVASSLEEPSLVLDTDVSEMYLLDSPSRFSTVGDLESPSHMTVHTFEPHASLASTVAPGMLNYSPTKNNVNLNEPSIETIDLVNLQHSRPASPEKPVKPSKSTKKSKKDRKSPNKAKIQPLGAEASILTYSDIDEGVEIINVDDIVPSRSASPTKSQGSVSPGRKRSEMRPVDDEDITGSMRFAAPSKFARQNPALLMQQPSRVLQKLMEDGAGANAERKYSL